MEATENEVGRGSAAGLALSPFAILSCFWIPTLALLLGAATVVAAAIDLRGASGRRRRVALLTIGLGVLAIVGAVIVVIVASGPASEIAAASVPPPG